MSYSYLVVKIKARIKHLRDHWLLWLRTRWTKPHRSVPSIHRRTLHMLIVHRWHLSRRVIIFILTWRLHVLRIRRKTRSSTSINWKTLRRRAPGLVWGHVLTWSNIWHLHLTNKNNYMYQFTPIIFIWYENNTSNEASHRNKWEILTSVWIYTNSKTVQTGQWTKVQISLLYLFFRLKKSEQRCWAWYFPVKLTPRNYTLLVLAPSILI